MTIGTLAARIMADASGIKSGMGLTRDELKITRQAFIDSTSDVGKLNIALAQLESARGKGAFANEQQYAAAIRAVREELDPAVIAERSRLAAIQESAAKLKDQIATHGLSANAIQLYRLEQQGATKDERASIAALQQQQAALQASSAAEVSAAAKSQQLNEAVSRTRDELQQQVKTFGMSADQIQVYNLRQQGATTEQLRSVAVLQQQRAALETTAAAQRTAAAAHEQAMQRGRAMAEGLRTPEEQRNVRMREVKDLLDQAAISQQTYNRAAGQINAEKWREVGTNIRNTAAAVGAASGAVAVGMGLVGRDMLNAYAEAEGAQKKLAAAMRAAGTDAASTMASYQAFAAQVQKVTTTDDDAAIAMLQHAESLGVSGKAAERAVTNAIALKAALGVDADAAVKMTAALEQGSTTLLARHLPALKGVESEAGKAAMAQQLLGKMFATAEAEAQSFAGSQAQLKNSVSNLKEEFGAIIAEGMQPFVQTATGVVASLAGMSDGNKRLIAYTGMAVTGLASVVTTGAGVVATGGQMVIAYGALQKTATGAAVAQWAMNHAAIAGKVAMGGLAIGGIAAVSYAVYQAMPSIRALNAELAKSKQTADLLAGRRGKEREQVISASIEMAEPDKLKYLQDEIVKAETNLKGLGDRAAMTRTEADKLAPSLWSGYQSGRAVWQASIAEADDLTARYGEQKEFVQRLYDEKNKLAAKPVVDAETAKAVAKLNAELKEQIATAGMTAEQIKLWKLEQAGATKEQLASVAAAQQQAAAAVGAKELHKDAVALAKSLEDQAAKAGKTEDQLQLLRLAARGLSPEWLAMLQAMQTKAKAAEKLAEVKKQVDDITKSLKEQIATAGMTAEQAERVKLAQAGATAAQLAGVEALQQQAALVKEAADAKKKSGELGAELQFIRNQTDAVQMQRLAKAGLTAEQEKELALLKLSGASETAIATARAGMVSLTKANQQRTIADRIRAVQDETALLRLQKDAQAQSELAAKGLTAEQQMELDRLRAQGHAVGELEAAFKRANQAKRALQATDTTTTSKTLAEAYDIMRAAREARPVTPPVATPAANNELPFDREAANARAVKGAADRLRLAQQAKPPTVDAWLDRMDSAKPTVIATATDIVQPIPESAKSGTTSVSADQAEQQIGLMNRQLEILERIAESNGVTIQEVQL